jgi:excisionase family DNA binding protein
MRESRFKNHSTSVPPEEDSTPVSITYPKASEWLTAAEAASYLRVKPRTILFWVRRGQLKGHRLSGTRRVTWRFLRSDLDATLTAPSVALTKRRIQ